MTPISVPDDLSERDQWVLWRFEDRSGRPTKVPYQVGGRCASSTDPKTWTSFDAVANEWRNSPEWYSGLGFVFSAIDPFCGIDLDDSLDLSGNPKPWAQPIIERFSDTYMEISPSGVGLKIWVRGTVPANLGGAKVGDGQIEIYDHARYFAVTGRRFRDAPLEIEHHAADVHSLYERLTKRTNGR
jgi:putative DNA primase/helicase